MFESHLLVKMGSKNMIECIDMQTDSSAWSKMTYVECIPYSYSTLQHLIKKQEVRTNSKTELFMLSAIDR